MKIISVVGARPNFIKIAPFIRAINSYNEQNINWLQHSCMMKFTAIDTHAESRPNIDHLLVHTGQHYDYAMSTRFFSDLDIPHPDINLEVGSGSHAEQVGKTMIAFEKVIHREKPDWVVLVGDVNATCACSITAKKENVRCAHIEAGLRSRDMTMPEEINRLITDRLSDLLLTPDQFSEQNLCAEGVSQERIKFVGNIMIDTLEAQRRHAESLSTVNIVKKALLDDQCEMSYLQEKDISSKNFAVVTIHRPSNVDSKDSIFPIIKFLISNICKDIPVVWPIHPRTQQRLIEFEYWKEILNCHNCLVVSPLGYHELFRLNMCAKIMLTDSGGIQEECCVHGTPCLTLRNNTERPVTLLKNGGVSILTGNDLYKIKKSYYKLLTMKRKPTRPVFWDGNTAPRVLKALLDFDQCFSNNCRYLLKNPKGSCQFSTKYRQIKQSVEVSNI